jgi:protein-disulfide isomerase
MNTARPRLALPVGARDHIWGPASAPVTLVEYADYECPFCKAAHPIVQHILRLMKNRLRFVYRHFPLTSVHPHAEPAAEAAEAAGAQDRFWPMHDRLFEHEGALEDEDLAEHAAAVGLDVARFARELAGGIYAPRVREDFMSGVRSGVNGTPAFYINGLRHDGGFDAKSLLEGIEYASEPVTGPLAERGTPRS